MKLKKIVDFNEKEQKHLRYLLYFKRIKGHILNGYRAIDLDEYNEYQSTRKLGRPLKGE